MSIADKQQVWDLLGRMCREGSSAGRFDTFRSLIGRLNYKTVSRALSVKLSVAKHGRWKSTSVLQPFTGFDPPDKRQR